MGRSPDEILRRVLEILLVLVQMECGSESGMGERAGWRPREKLTTFEQEGPLVGTVIKQTLTEEKCIQVGMTKRTMWIRHTQNVRSLRSKLEV
jgi:hypothetical protein